MNADLKRDFETLRWLGVAEGVCWAIAVAAGAATVWLVLR